MTRRAHASCGASSAGGLFSSAGTIPAFADDGLTAFETAIGLLHDGALHQKDGVQPERESPVYAVTSWYRQKCRQAVGSPTASQAPASGPVRTQPFVRRMTAIKRFHSGPWEPRNCTRSRLPNSTDSNSLETLVYIRRTCPMPCAARRSLFGLSLCGAGVTRPIHLLPCRGVSVRTPDLPCGTSERKRLPGSLFQRVWTCNCCGPHSRNRFQASAVKPWTGLQTAFRRKATEDVGRELLS